MPWIPQSVRNEVNAALNHCSDIIDCIDTVERTLSKIDTSRVIVLPCSFGDRLWFCYNDDDGGQPKIEQSDPVKGFLIEPGGRISATTDFCCYDQIGGPDLWLTEDQAKAEQARRLLKQNQTQAEEMKEEKTDGSL